MVPFAHVDRNALTDGFGVAEFELQDTSRDPLTFAWLAPQQSERVVCALFASAPEFSHSEQQTEERLVRLLNEGRAVARKRTFNTADIGSDRRFSFKLADLEASGVCPTPLSIPIELAGSYPIVQLLRVGCWAFDDTKVIAATRLAIVEPSSLPDWDTVPQPTCLGQPDRSWCRMPGTPGSCQGGVCDPSRSPSAPQMGAAGSGGDAGEPLAPPTDCTDLADDVGCLQKSDEVGQCSSGQCIAQDAQDYEPPLVVSSCAVDRTEGLNCYPSPILDFGSCFKGKCEPRCDQDQDCVSPFQRVGIADVDKQVCYIADDAYVGSCQAEP